MNKITLKTSQVLLKVLKLESVGRAAVRDLTVWTMCSVSKIAFQELRVKTKWPQLLTTFLQEWETKHFIKHYATDYLLRGLKKKVHPELP